MVTLDVTFQAHVVVEAHVTELTLVRPLPGVQTHVGLQVARLVEATLAHRTLVRFQSCVHNGVPPETMYVLEVNPTDSTFELPRDSVLCQVAPAFFTGGECLWTVGTFKGIFFYPGGSARA